MQRRSYAKGGAFIITGVRPRSVGMRPRMREPDLMIIFRRGIPPHTCAGTAQANFHVSIAYYNLLFRPIALRKQHIPVPSPCLLGASLLSVRQISGANGAVLFTVHVILVCGVVCKSRDPLPGQLGRPHAVPLRCSGSLPSMAMRTIWGIWRISFPAVLCQELIRYYS
jgi:hypothetical protein